jgi:hypothetical protein
MLEAQALSANDCDQEAIQMSVEENLKLMKTLALRRFMWVN